MIYRVNASLPGRVNARIDVRLESASPATVGWPEVVEEAKRILRANGLSEEEIASTSFEPLD